MARKTDPHVRADEQPDEFYEAMPMTAGRYMFGPDVMADESDVKVPDTRRTALITLTLVMLTAALLGVLFAKGLQMLKNDVSSNPSVNTIQP